MANYEKEVREGRYYNANGYACAIVATVNYYDGELFDWAAYMGGCSTTASKLLALDDVARHGSKISYSDAAHFFPNLPIERYRD